MQRRFWNKQLNAFRALTGNPNLTMQQVYNMVDLNVVMAEAANQQAVYGGKWISAGKNQSSAVKGIRNAVESPKGRMRFLAVKPSRLQQLGHAGLAGLAFWGIIGQGVGLAKDIANGETPDQRQKLETVASRYEEILRDAETPPHTVSNNKLHLLVDDIGSWLLSYNSIESDHVEKAKAIMKTKIDLTYPPGN